MAPKPPSGLPLFLEYPAEPGELPEPEGDGPSHPEGSPYAIQDDRPRFPEGVSSAAARAAPQESQAASNHECVRGSSENQAQPLDGCAPSGAAGERAEQAL